LQRSQQQQQQRQRQQQQQQGRLRVGRRQWEETMISATSGRKSRWVAHMWSAAEYNWKPPLFFLFARLFSLFIFQLLPTQGDFAVWSCWHGENDLGTCCGGARRVHSD
jgi:hypothetical protein